MTNRMLEDGPYHEFANQMERHPLNHNDSIAGNDHHHHVLPDHHYYSEEDATTESMSWHRMLGGSDYQLYYGALSVAVLTLGMLLFVEAIRRKLDRSAAGRPFYQAVLDGVYRELSTLGVVELFIHLLQTYSAGLDKNKQALFADIHFLLFYTALFNAFQSVIMAVITRRISTNMWVKTEELELSHYVEIRIEYAAVHEELYGCAPADKASRHLEQKQMGQDVNTATAEGNANDTDAKSQALIPELNPMAATNGAPSGVLDESINSNDQSFWESLRAVCLGLLYTVRYPRLKARYNNLLVQVRFHELRVHFLQAYDLPLKLKVSDYLMNSEQHVLTHLVHVSTWAWLWLTGLVNVLYFITGMIADSTGTSESTATSLSIAFFLGMVLFVVTSVLVHQQMKHIFMKIMDMKHLWDIYQPVGEQSTDAKRFHHPDLASEQLGLFWLQDPKLVVTLIQFIQFGYAIALSVVVVFWDSMNRTKFFSAKYYLGSVLVSYALFVTVMSRVIPRYTMCTSLGQLVDRKRLHETVAMYRLEEAERRMLQRMENAKNDPFAKSKAKSPVARHTNDGVSGIVQTPETRPEDLPETASSRIDKAGDFITEVPPDNEQITECPPDILDGLVVSRPLEPSSRENTTSSIREITEERASILVDLVKMDTKALRNAIPLERDRAAELRERRRSRRKSVSDGVALMAALKSAVRPFGMSYAAPDAVGSPEHPTGPGIHGVDLSAINKSVEEPDGQPKMKFAVDDSALLKRKERRRSSKKTVSASAAIQEMRSYVEAGPDVENQKTSGTVEPKLAQNTDGGDKKGPLGLPLFQKGFLASSDERNARRKEKRKKSLSASAAVRLMRDLDDGDDFQAMKEFWQNPDMSSSLTAIDEKDSNAMPQTPSSTGQHGMFMSEDTHKRAPDDNQPSRFPTSMEVLREAPGLLEDPSERSGFLFSPTLQAADDKAVPLNSGVTNNGGPETADFGSKSYQDDDSGILAKDADGEDTVDTAGSVGGLSDVDELSDENMLYYRHYTDDASVHWNLYSCISLLSWLGECLRGFFLGNSYYFFTHMIGTMICFYLVGMRVEGFLQEQCVVPSDYFLNLDLTNTFWCLAAFQALFIAISLWKVFLFRPFRRHHRNSEGIKVGSHEEQWSMLVGALVDIVICVSCLSLLCIAEINRCCAGDETDTYPVDHEYGNFRLLGGGAVGSYGESGSAECKDTTLLCTCPAFGTRLEGGIGQIEPFTSLIGLRVFRFLVARRIVDRLNLRKHHDEDFEQGDAESSRQNDEFYSHIGGKTTTVLGDRESPNDLKRGTAVELWQAAIAKHPAIVDRYGEFSGELLRAMLGVPVADHTLPMSPSSQAEKSSQPAFEPPPSRSTEGKVPAGLHRRNSSCLSIAGKDTVFTLDEKKYCTLAPEVQGIIAAGRMGMPVKSCRDVSTMMETANSDDGAATELHVPAKPSRGELEFEVDVAQMELDQLESSSPFEFPNARLVRSMRRCDRKWLPLLNKWCPVDVVITNHELVYIDACGTGHDSDGDRKLQEVGRQALIATKGGKGLRLCDVTAGRRVVGQLKFTDITSVHVERECPVSGVHAVESTDKHREPCHVELWQDMSNINPADSDRQQRWEHVNEDRLKIQTIHGTLFLRFYSDLEAIEAHPELIIEEENEDNPLFKDIALQWAQTIVRHCSLEQLKQPLVHFGTDSELRDYLQIYTREEKPKGFLLPASRSHRRLASRDHRRGRTPFSFLHIMTEINNSQGQLEEPAQSDGPPVSEGVPGIPPRRRLSRLGSINAVITRPKALSEDGARAVTIG